MPKRKKSDQLIPPSGSAGVAERVFDILSQVVADKESMDLENKWYRFYELGKNKQWRKNNPELTLVSANLLSVHRRRTVNTLTDNNPTFNLHRVVAKDDTDDRFKAVLNATEYWWNETEQQDILEKSVINGETYGVCIEKVVFDLDKEYGIGEVDTVIVDPFNFGIYPVKCLDIQKAQAVLHYYPMSVRDIKREYGEAAKDVVADADVVHTVSDDRRYVSGLKETVLGRGSSVTSIGGALRNLSKYLTGNRSNIDGDEALVVECWVKDYSVDKDGVPLYTGNIRVITAVNGSVVLCDKNNPSINPRLPERLVRNTYLYDKFPFAKANSNKDPVNFWGEGDYEQLAGLQMEFNKSISQFSSLKDKVAGVKFVNPKTSGVHNSKITSGATVLSPDTQNHGMGYLNPPPIPRELTEGIELYKELFFAVAGTFDLEQANTPGSQVIAYKAIAALIERASTMMRGKIRNYSKLIRERGRMAVSMMQNWYTEDRYISFVEDGVERSDYVYGPDMIVPMKLSVVSGSTMPVSEVQRREEALSLYDKGAIDNEELLKALDWPKYHEVVTRMRSGPVQQFIEKMTMIGMPQEMAQYMAEVAQMEDNKLERAIDRSEMATFDQLFKFLGMQPDVKKEIDVMKAESELNESEARAKKIEAERVKILAEAEKEVESIRQTDDRIRVDKAKVISDSRVKELQLLRGNREKESATA